MWRCTCSGPSAQCASFSTYERRYLSCAGSGHVCPLDDLAEPFVVGVVVAPDDVPADHAALLSVAGVVGAVKGEVPQRRELRLYAVYQDEFVGV